MSAPETGLELFALGVEQVVGHVDEALVAEAAVALFGGVALCLLGHVACRFRESRAQVRLAAH